MFYRYLNVHLNVPKGPRIGDLYSVLEVVAAACLLFIFWVAGVTRVRGTYLASTRIPQLQRTIGPQSEMKYFRFCNVIKQ